MARGQAAGQVDVSQVINAPQDLVLRAFFDHAALGAWQHALRSVTTPRLLGAYAIEWQPTDFADEVLGRLGGVFRGTIMQFDTTRGFFVADAYWLPPDGPPIGPMALDVSCVTGPPVEPDPASPAPEATHVRVRQTGFEENPRWRRYYEVASEGWERSLTTLKGLLER